MRETLSSQTEPFVVHIGGFGVVRSVAVFDEVEMRFFGLGDMS